MRVLLRASAEAIALEEPLTVGQRVRWFVHRPSDLGADGLSRLAEEMEVNVSLLDDATFAIENHDDAFSLREDDAAWLEGTIIGFPPTTGRWAHGHVLVDLDDVSTEPYAETDPTS